ncbi:ATP-binding protein [Chitinimonas arctica]|uniref:ATP-binding protein n=1 Tax=Chitinimonas arctica TaxID=2594795 RepID=A0A516SLH5_9NEIS|nr:ATP-binding protein [Chitinimonas arctica]QDQ29004.1 ATP-binding protein [Chitinimonas arctica]
MSDTGWLDANNRYLAASLQWLRLTLTALVPGDVGDAPPVGTVGPTPGLLDWFKGGKSNGAPVGQVALPAPSSANLLEQVSAAREAAARCEPLPALLQLADRMGLSDFERDTLLLCVAAELDPSQAALCAAIPGCRGYPSFALAMQAFSDPAWEALSPHRPLRYLRLLEINQPGTTPLTAAGLRADERIVNCIKGLNVLDERLGLLLGAPLADSGSLSASQSQVASEIAAQLHLGAAAGRVPVVLLLGVDDGSKAAVADQVAAGLQRRLYRLSLADIPTARTELETFARLWQRETMLLGVAIHIDAGEWESAGHEQASALQWLLTRDLGLVFVSVRERPAWPLANSYGTTVSKPTPAEQRDAWLDVLAERDAAGDHAETAALLAGQFCLSLRDIDQVAGLAEQTAGPLPPQLWRQCCELARPRLDLLAQRLEPKADWDDLVLPAEASSLLKQIVTQVHGRYRVYQDWGYAQKMTRGLGISALFAGESGTGKTMAAEVLANALQLALYRIDLSAIVSKYIGETEKNLRKLFDAAEQGGAILFFDEADALFGKRSEVKDSHDRYANIEVNYLLQRMESFSGIAILATNMKSALDAAFMRRLRFIVNFPFPGLPERKLMWQKALAPTVPSEGLDFERLARFNLSGGNIQSIALNAAFAAAVEAGAVSMPLLLSATRTELRKLDKQINESEFRAIQSGGRS